MTRRAVRHPSEPAEPTLAGNAYQRIKAEIFDFALLPGDRFSEAALALRLGMSRTPVREALGRLQREGYLAVQFKSGWSVKPFDFEQFEHLYDLRMVLETTSVERLCAAPLSPLQAEQVAMLKSIWVCPRRQRLSATNEVAALDEAFHITLVEAAGNPEIARVHHAVTERIRIIRRLDFTQPARIEATYEEHAHILSMVEDRRSAEAARLLRSHIEISKAEVRKISQQKLSAVRTASARPAKAKR